MSRFVEIPNFTCVEDIIKMVEPNPAGGIFRFANNLTREEFFRDLAHNKVKWLFRDPKNKFDVNQFLDFERHNRCDIIIRKRQQIDAGRNEGTQVRPEVDA